MKLQYSLLFVLVLGQKKEGPGSSLFGCLLYFYNMQNFLFWKKRQNILFFYIISVAPFTNFLNAFSPFRTAAPFFSIHMFPDGSTGSFARTMQANDFPYSIPAFTKRQSWMLPDLSVQRKTPNRPKLKSLTYCVICYIMYIS